MTRYRTYETTLVEWLRRDPDNCRDYLEGPLAAYNEDQDSGALLLALRAVADAQGGIGRLAKVSDVGRQTLYKALSAEGNPRLDTVGAILRGLGYELALQPINASPTT